MPHFVANGSHRINLIKHRFVVMPRYGDDIWQLYEENGNKIPEHTIYRLAIQMVGDYDLLNMIVFNLPLICSLADRS